jgi:hypothetical protein
MCLKGEMLMQERKFDDAAKTYAEGFGQASLPSYKALLMMGAGVGGGGTPEISGGRCAV